MPPLLSNDLTAAAEQFIALVRQRRLVDAFAQLDGWRAVLTPDLREALDRRIAHRLAQPEFLFQWPPAPYLTALLPLGTALQDAATRIQNARMLPPPMPAAEGLTPLQQYDIYASIVEVRGSAAAVQALNDHQRVILGLRAETSTLANRGQGVYDDRLVVLAKGNGTPPAVTVFLRVSTEPTAQYDGNQRNNPSIRFRRAEGDNIAGDAEPELGRLAEGTIQMLETTHHNPASAGTNFSLRPTAAAVAAGAGGVQRDVNHDGWFDAQDTNGRTALNNTFKIHSGSRTNTDSAGCQTLHPDDFLRFRDAVTADPSQTTWYYVLSRTGVRVPEWHIPMPIPVRPRAWW